MKRNLVWIVIVIIFLNIFLFAVFDDRIRQGMGTFVMKVAHAFYSPDSGEAEEWWICPMHPFYKRKAPGECGICGMTLVPQSELTEPVEGIVMLSPQQVQLGGVRTEAIHRSGAAKTIDTFGRIDYDERKIQHVTAWTGGRVDRLYVNFTGDVVHKGAPLVWLYSPELITTQEEYLISLRNVEKVRESSVPDVSRGARELLESTRKRLLRRGITERQIADLEKTRSVQDHITIHAPMGGVVIEKNVNEGMYVKEGTRLFVIAPLDVVWLYADIYEYEIPLISVGQEVEITTRSFPDEVFTGKVAFIDPFLDPKTRTVKIRCNIPNGSGKLKPDMYARVILKVPMEGDRLLIPEDAVIHSGKRNIVFVNLGGGRFEPRLVDLGPRVGRAYEVNRGVVEGEQVVTSANFLLSSESQLQGVLEQIETMPAEVLWEKYEHERLARGESPAPVNSPSQTQPQIQPQIQPQSRPASGSGTGPGH